MAFKVHGWNGELVSVEEPPVRGIMTITLRQLFYALGITKEDCDKAFEEKS